MKNILIRKSGSGLGSLRAILSKMNNKDKCLIRNSSASNTPRPITPTGENKPIMFNWGNYGDLLNSYSDHYHIINNPLAISNTSNKKKFRMTLQNHYVRTPYTIDTRDKAVYFFSIRGITMNNKLIVRPVHHSQGRDLHLVSNIEEFDNAVSEIGGDWYASDYIIKEKEFRIFVAHGRIVYVVEKIVEDRNQPAWNVHAGGRFENVRFSEWPLDACVNAIQAFNTTGLEFGAVDVIMDANGNTYVLEINTSPSQETEYWSSCVAKVFDYIIDHRDVVNPVMPVDTIFINNLLDYNDNDNIELPNGYSIWKDLIHPAISSEAIERGQSLEYTTGGCECMSCVAYHFNNTCDFEIDNNQCCVYDDYDDDYDEDRDDDDYSYTEPSDRISISEEWY